MNKQELSTMSAADLISFFGNKSRAIRGLDKKQFSRTEISKLLGLRYQHVRNVLITPTSTKGVAVTEDETETDAE